MHTEHHIIRQSKWKLWAALGIALVLIFAIVAGPYSISSDSIAKRPGMSILVGVIFLWLLIYLIAELVNRPAEITLSKEGIELRDKGFFEWPSIASFSINTYPYSDDKITKLVLHFKEAAEVKFEITNLEKTEEELVDLILQYKGETALVFTGHREKR